MSEAGMELLNSVKKQTQAGRLLEIADKAEYWHTPQQKAYATLTVQGHRESHAIEDASFRDWLVHAYYREYGHGPNGTALRNVLTLLVARATQAGKQHQAHLRVAEHDGDIYIDLGDPDWRAVHISRSGWTIDQSPPVRFARAQGTKAMPTPATEGRIDDLYSVVNVHDEDLPLLTAWLLGALFPRGPYPILLLQGPPGAAKSTLARLLKSIVDPNDLELRAAPRDMRDLQIAALHSRCVALDNLSHVPQELSDTLCRLATGEATSTRTLYTNTGETVVKVQCPVILTGIGAIASQADLLDRAIVLSLHPIPDTGRIPESDYWRRWEAVKASVFGALLDAASHGLRTMDGVRMTRLPRMADFARWIIACEPALWPSGTFLAAYAENRSDARQITLDADPVGQAIVTLMQDRAEWSGTPSELLQQLEFAVPEKTQALQAWPRSAHILSRKLARIEGVLADSGICIVTRRDGHARTRTLMITRNAPPESADAADATSVQETQTWVQEADAADTADGIFGAETDAMRTLRTHQKSSVRSSVRTLNPSAERDSAFADAADATALTFNIEIEKREERVKGEASAASAHTPANGPSPRQWRFSDADATADTTADATFGQNGQTFGDHSNPLYAYLHKTVYTSEGPAVLVQVFADRVAVQYPGQGQVTYLPPGRVFIDELLS